MKLTGSELKKHRLKNKILYLLYKNNSLSGTALSHRIGVSLPTALMLISDLISSNFVETRGPGDSKGGRKPSLFGLAITSFYVVACELERYRGKITIYNANNEMVSPVVFIDTSIDDDNLAEKIHVNALNLISDFDIQLEKVIGIGVIMPGLVDEVSGVNYTIKKEEYRNVKERIEKKFGKFVYINNDARMQAYGEYMFGAAKGHKNAIILNWNWGIGMGMILDDKLYNGSSGFAGELSHAKFTEEGDLCICGKRGCLETTASANALVKNAVAGIKSERISQLTEKFKSHEHQLQPEHIIQAAKSGDEFSISLLHNLGFELGKGLSFSIQLLNPGIIVLGGIISNANQFVLNSIQQALNKYCLEQISAKVDIVISKNWENNGMQGVSAMLFQKLFTENFTINQINQL